MTEKEVSFGGAPGRELLSTVGEWLVDYVIKHLTRYISSVSN